MDVQAIYIKEMIERAKSACSSAYNIYSKFPVGACVRSNIGKYYDGCNVENGSYSLTICAEASAIASMVNGGCRLVTDVVVFSNLAAECKPCGACRQIINEFANDSTKIHVCDVDGYNIRTILIRDLLPEPFILS